jgi:hypothetical protein
MKTILPMPRANDEQNIETLPKKPGASKWLIAKRGRKSRIAPQVIF